MSTLIFKPTNRIKEVMEQKDVTRKELGQRLDVIGYGRVYQTLRNFIHNYHQPRMDLLFAIAHVLDVAPCDLIGHDANDVSESASLHAVEQN